MVKEPEGNKTSTRSRSEMAFINAAGKLFSERGIDAVTIRSIAEAAGIDASMIKYHFGSKEGLVLAVIEHAVSSWRRESLHSYYEENKLLLEKRDGQIVFVSGMVELMFRIFQSGHEEGWCKSFILQLLQRRHPTQNKLIDKYVKPGISTFFEVYRRITGNDDFESAFCWYLFMICPVFMYSGSPDMINRFHLGGEVSMGFDRRLMIFTTRQLLAGFGLA